MDIIISANEKILSMTQDESQSLSRSMTEEDYNNWLERMVKVKTDEENSV